MTATATCTPTDALWQRLAQWSPQAEARACGFARTLTHRLCQRLGWRTAYAERAVEEYRRFMWLLVQRRGALCPSEAVDAAWHEHLLDSRTYFEHFCPQVLGQTMHHVPARGGEGDVHRQRYRATLQAYAQAFGHPPPADIWPAPHKRWRAKPWLTAHRPAALWPALALLGLVLAGCAQLVGTDAQQRLSGPVFLLFYMLMLLLLGGWALYLHKSFRPSRRAAKEVVELPLLDLAFVAGGPWRVALTSAARLWQAGHVQWQAASDAASETQGTWLAGPAPLPPDAGEIDRKLYRALLQGDEAQPTVMALKPQMAEMQQRLWRQGLLHTPRRKAWYADPQAALLAGLYALLWGLGVLRFFSGLALGRPVLWLALLLLLMTFALPLLWRRGLRPTRLTRQGWQSRQRGRERFGDVRVTEPGDERLPGAVAVQGSAAMAGAVLPLGLLFVPPAARGAEGGTGGCSGGLGSSSGDGGGGCGGGCGGCGG